MRRTGVLRGGPGRCGLVLGDVREAAYIDSANEGYVLLSFRKARHRTNPDGLRLASYFLFALGSRKHSFRGGCDRRRMSARSAIPPDTSEPLGMRIQPQLNIGKQ